VKGLAAVVPRAHGGEPRRPELAGRFVEGGVHRIRRREPRFVSLSIQTLKAAAFPEAAALFRRAAVKWRPVVV